MALVAAPITAFFNLLFTAHGSFSRAGLGLLFLSFPLVALTSPTPQYLCSFALFLNRHGVSRYAKIVVARMGPTPGSLRQYFMILYLRANRLNCLLASTTCSLVASNNLPGDGYAMHPATGANLVYMPYRITDSVMVEIDPVLEMGSITVAGMMNRLEEIAS
jgi:hypothetical protein